MTENIDEWILFVDSLVIKPELKWIESIPEDEDIYENSHFHYFHEFINFPINSLEYDTLIDVNILESTPEFQTYSEKYLKDNIKKVTFDKSGFFALASFILRKNPKLIEVIQMNEINFTIYIWCLSQIVDKSLGYVLEILNEKLLKIEQMTSTERVNGILLLLQVCLSKYNINSKPPITSDKFELIYAMSYSDSIKEYNKISSFLLPHIVPLISESSAAHLLFRRILPYCSCPNDKARKTAFEVLEQILAHHTNVPSIISTWLSLHPFCVPASNNLLVNLERKGLITSQMKVLIRQLIYINSLIRKNQIILNDKIRGDLPRSLWKAPFPPPESEIDECNKNCQLLLASFSSKRLTMFYALLLFVFVYVFYLFS